MLRRVSVIAFLLAVLFSQNQASAGAEKRFKNLPEGWKIERSFVASPAQTAAISQKLGARISRLTNTIFSVKGQRLQVNVLSCPTARDAEKTYEALLATHGGHTLCTLRDGNSVVEFVSKDINLIKAAHRVLGFAPVQLDGLVKDLIKELPVGWQLVESFIVPPEETARIEKSLGGRIKELSNTILSVHGHRLQVNIIECATPGDADKIHERVLAMKGHPAFCLRLDNSVVEFVAADVSLAIKAAYELGLKPKPTEARYRISFEAAPLEKCDYMLWNKLVNLFLALDRNPEAKTLKSQIAEVSQRFQFGNELSLRTCGTGDTKPTYSFKPAVGKTEAMAHGDITKYTFKDLPLKMGVPSVSIAATVSTREQADMPSLRKADDKLLGPTKFWPSDDPEIISLAEKITAGCKSDEDKVKAILEWLRPGKNIKFGGPVTGSRYGVKKALKQGFGQCWDFSDCFITLCRALKIPCRQVAGWFYGASGHIWAEVLLDGKRWRQIDPTGGGVVGCDIYHIPYLTSEDGSLAILYLSLPKIEFLGQEGQK